VYAMNAYRGSGDMAPLILNLTLDGGSSQLHVPSALLPVHGTPLCYVTDGWEGRRIDLGISENRKISSLCHYRCTFQSDLLYGGYTGATDRSTCYQHPAHLSILSLFVSCLYRRQIPNVQPEQTKLIQPEEKRI
jgi:hypothetical protein